MYGIWLPPLRGLVVATGCPALATVCSPQPPVLLIDLMGLGRLYTLGLLWPACNRYSWTGPRLQIVFGENQARDGGDAENDHHPEKFFTFDKPDGSRETITRAG